MKSFALSLLAFVVLTTACSNRRGRNNPTVAPFIPTGAACSPGALFAESPDGCTPALSRDVAFGDLDGDGDLDAVVAAFGQNRLLLQTAPGRLQDSTDSRMPTAFDATNSVALTDVDFDGDLDIVFGNIGQSTLYFNDGMARFEDATAGRIPTENTNTFGVHPIDADGDGDPDLLIANAANCVVDPDDTNCTGTDNLLLINVGAGVFEPSTSIPGTGDTRKFAIGDLNGDLVLDVIAAQHFVDSSFPSGVPVGRPNEVRLAANGTSGEYLVGGSIQPEIADRTNSIALGDVDGDGDLDAFFANSTRSRLMLNDGAGNFTESIGSIDLDEFEAPVEDAQLVDLDNDGDLDLVVTGMERPTRAYTNNGAGGFSSSFDTLLPPSLSSGNAVEVLDIDGDGRLDVYVANGGLGGAQTDRVLINDGSGKLIERSPIRLPQTLDGVRSIAAGDINGDSHIDLVFGTEDGVALFENDSQGVYRDRTADFVSALGAPAESSFLADFDRDGDLDLVAALTAGPNPANGRPNALLLNAGDGSMTDVSATNLPGQADPSYALGVGDFDADGDLDIVVGNIGVNRLYLNDGAANFSDATGNLPAASDSTEAFVLGDIDLDGDTDIVVGNTNRLGGDPQNRILINEGAAQFVDATSTRFPVDLESTNGLALGDVDGDGDLDIFAANSGVSVLYANDGAGVFTDESALRLPLSAGRADSATFVDVDGDGDQDLLLTASGLQSRILLNDGAGVFSDAPSTLLPAAGTADAAFAVDVDLDQDVDLVFATATQTRLLINRTRQFELVTAARIGQPLQFEITAAPGTERTFQAIPVAAILGVMPPAFVGDAGFLQVEPAIANKLSVIPVGPPTNVGSGSIDIPNEPGLIGDSVFMQAILIEDGTGETRLTNLGRTPFVQ